MTPTHSRKLFFSNTVHHADHMLIEPRYEKTGYSHMRKQRRRSAAQ